MPFSVLFVCTGNICRSPMAERLMLARLAVNAPVTVSSAGTAGLTGWGMDAPCARALQELGVDSDGHIAQRVTSELVQRSDLVLTAQAAHRSTIVQDDPPAFRRVFTLREFGRLAASLDRPPLASTAEALRARVAAVADQRGRVDAPALGEDDIGDPYGASFGDARRCARQVADAVDALITALGLPTRVPVGS